MAAKPETLFRQKFQRKLELIPDSWFESIQQKSIGGTPDKLGLVRGRFVGLEFKASADEKPTPMQLLKLSRIRAAGGIAEVVFPENADEIFRLLMEIQWCR